ncbi:amidohydrolase family protein [Jiangella mangrovi]|uniref:Putative amidohydrolase n=1 Tax=Jiangella mangrovi TaxID=1524084 RepID=A0A7W9GRA7_9ACTN|nr:amidohydrolase [Jiangella mangrovi]MBB5788580.1 putative amidohydrolase [Jiangella mangrovi]
MFILKNGRLVVGDGRTPAFTGSLVIDGDRIAAAGPDDYTGGLDDTVVDLGGRLVLPGALDCHAHAVAPGPRFASGTPGVSLPEVMGNLRRHLSQGHTTVVDLDGFKLPAETTQVTGQPVRVASSTVHFEPMFQAADAADGSGLTAAHRDMTAAAMADAGAVVIGEVGAGMTLGGGGQDYLYIPAAVEKATGTRLTPAQSKALKYAVLGRHIRPGAPDTGAVRRLLTEYGLAERLPVADAVALIEDSVLPSFQTALDGLVRSADLAVDLGIPTLVHNSAPSDEAARTAAKVAGPLFIGGHTNHGTFSADEAVASARYIREQGGHVELDTFDAWGRRELHAAPEHLIALVQEGLVDVIATDYASGHWDGVFSAVEAIVGVGLASLEAAVAMVSGNVARALPRLGDRGLLRPGRLADVVVTSPRHPSDIELVIVGGEVVLAAEGSGLREPAR